MRKIIFLFLFPLFLTSCGKDYHYSDFNDQKIDNLNNMYLQKEEKYGVYLYRDDCPHCQDIRNDLLSFVEQYKTGAKDFKIYLYNTIRLKNENIKYISDSSLENEAQIKQYFIENKVNTIEKTVINFVPSLYVINDGICVDFYLGNSIIAYLNSI